MAFNFTVSQIWLPLNRRWQISQGVYPTRRDVTYINGAIVDTVWSQNPATNVPFAPMLGTDPNALLGICLRASFSFPADWRDTSKQAGSFRLQLSNHGILLESTSMPLSHIPNPVPQEPINILVPGLKLVTPRIGTIQGPFCSQGPWTATLVCYDMYDQPTASIRESPVKLCGP